MRQLPQSIFVVVAMVCGACDKDEPAQKDVAMIAGPYAEAPALGQDFHQGPLTVVDHIEIEAPVYFYWYHPGNAERLTWVLKAEAAGALSHGAPVHEESFSIEGASEGVVSFRPQALNRGGARRNDENRLEWVEGLYSVTAKSGAGEIGNILFEAR
jgi:hypothetical protein